MKGVPKDLPVNRFVGDFLTQVSVGMDGIHFHFGKAGTISVGGKWELRDGASTLIDKAMEHAQRDAYRIHGIFNADVTGASIDPPRSFSLTFSTGHVLTVYDDSKQYEAFSIQPGNIFI